VNTPETISPSLKCSGLLTVVGAKTPTGGSHPPSPPEFSILSPRLRGVNSSKGAEGLPANWLFTMGGGSTDRVEAVTGSSSAYLPRGRTSHLHGPDSSWTHIHGSSEISHVIPGFRRPEPIAFALINHVMHAPGGVESLVL
jgi:hypothetical protein